MIRLKVIEWTVLFLLLVNSFFLWIVQRLDDRISAVENIKQEDFIMIGNPKSDEEFLLVPKEDLEEFKKELER